jgi:hypothetical protein
MNSRAHLLSSARHRRAVQLRETVSAVARAGEQQLALRRIRCRRHAPDHVLRVALGALRREERLRGGSLLGKPRLLLKPRGTAGLEPDVRGGRRLVVALGVAGAGDGLAHQPPLEHRPEPLAGIRVPGHHAGPRARGVEALAVRGERQREHVRRLHQRGVGVGVVVVVVARRLGAL